LRKQLTLYSFLIETLVQVKQFTNKIYQPEDPENPDIFDLKTITTKDIFDTITNHTTIFENKSVLSFA
jgi:hypothetical protein